MTQNPLIDSGTQSSKTPGLKPALAAALASLEVQLDQELARYRRTRTVSRTPNPSGVGSYINSQSQQLPIIPITSAKKLSVPEIKTNALPAPMTVNSQGNPAPATAKTNAPPTSISTPQENPVQTMAKTNDTPPASVPAKSQGNPVLTTAKTEEVENLKVSSTVEPTKTQIPPPPPPPLPKSGSIVPAVVKANNSENLLQADDTPKQPDDYLESSEALLRSLTEEQPKTNKPSNSSDSLLSPLGIGSILLLLLASLTLGYVVFNPKTLPQLNLGKLFNNNSPPILENTEKVGSDSQPQSQSQLTPIPKYPNLAAKEFPEVRDPNDVVGLKPKAHPTPIAVPNPVTPQNPLNPQAALPNSITAQKPIEPTAITPVQPLAALNVPPAPTAKTSPQPTETPPKLNAQIKPAADGFYHIVADNQGDRALASAKQIVPDAYLSRDKKFIYLGALKTQQEAQRQLQLLQSKGIKAQVQQP